MSGSCVTNDVEDLFQEQAMKRNIRNRSIALCGLIFITNLLWSSIVSPKPIKIICSTDNPRESLHVVALKRFGKLVEKYSNGKLTAQIHYRGNKELPAIRGEEVNINLVMYGSKEFKIGKPVHVTVIASGNASLKAHVLEFLMLPYIFPNIQSAERLFRSDLMMTEINRIIAEKHNIRAIGWLVGGYRHMTNSKKPVTRLKDIKGLIIRTPRNRLMRDTYTAFGATVKTLNWGDTFNALKKGDIDGQENPYNVIFTSKFWEAKQQYVTTNGPFLWVGPILINEKFYQSLSIDLRNAVDKAAMEASEYEWNWIAQKNDIFKQRLLDNGMQILELEDKSKWIEVTHPLWEKSYRDIGYGKYEKGKALVDRILKIIRE